MLCWLSWTALDFFKTRWCCKEVLRSWCRGRCRWRLAWCLLLGDQDACCWICFDSAQGCCATTAGWWHFQQGWEATSGWHGCGLSVGLVQIDRGWLLRCWRPCFTFSLHHLLHGFQVLTADIDGFLFLMSHLLMLLLRSGKAGCGRVDWQIYYAILARRLVAGSFWDLSTVHWGAIDALDERDDGPVIWSGSNSALSFLLIWLHNNCRWCDVSILFCFDWEFLFSLIFLLIKIARDSLCSDWRKNNFRRFNQFNLITI